MILAPLDEIRPPSRILATRERPDTDIAIAEEPTNPIPLCVFFRGAGTADVGAQQAVNKVGAAKTITPWIGIESLRLGL
jgi:hypothetical protein